MPKSDDGLDRVFRLYNEIIGKYGWTETFLQGPAFARAIVASWDCDYRVGNGGFINFFESLGPIDETIEAFTLLNVPSAAEAIRAAVRKFECEPPFDWDTEEQRLEKLRKLYSKHEKPNKVFEIQNRQYYDCCDSYYKNVAQFVLEHRPEFEKICGTGWFEDVSGMPNSPPAP